MQSNRINRRLDIFPSLAWCLILYIFDTIKYLENDMEQNKSDHSNVVERKCNFLKKQFILLAFYFIFQNCFPFFLFFGLESKHNSSTAYNYTLLTDIAAIEEMLVFVFPKAIVQGVEAENQIFAFSLSINYHNQSY